jgi:hypothetical protein
LPFAREHDFLIQNSVLLSGLSGSRRWKTRLFRDWRGQKSVDIVTESAPTHQYSQILCGTSLRAILAPPLLRM